MPTKEEMQSLAKEIVRSYEDRISGIAELRETVKADLKEFQDSRVTMANDLRADLAKSVAARKAAVSTQLKEMDAAHQAMARQQCADLAKGRSELADSIASKLKELDAAHAAMSREMRAELSKGRQSLANGDRKRQSEARGFIGELCQAVAEGKTAVKTLLGEFDSSHNAMSKEMRAELTRGHQSLTEGERTRQSEAREFMGELGKAVAEGKAATQALVRDFGEIQAGAQDEWQKMTATMQSKRGGVAVAVKPPIEEIAEGAAEITPETTALRGQVFEYLANHPDGTRLVGLAEEFGIARIQIAKVVRKLQDENKIEKRDLLYFAV